MSFFKPNDVNKTLLIYTSGGLGDKIMYCRFIRLICELYTKNKILFLIDDNLYYIFKQIYIDLPNITVIKFSLRNNFKFDYHTNITMLHSYLNLSYEKLYIDYYMENIQSDNKLTDDILYNIIDHTKLNIIIKLKSFP